MLKRLLLSIALLLAFSPISSASHILGGEVTWRCDTAGKFIFEVTLYRDCRGASVPSTISVKTPIGGVQANLDTVISRPNTCSGSLNPCQEGYSAHKYETDPVRISGTPPPQGWSISYATCCRLNSPSIAGSGGIFLEARIYPFTPEGASNPNQVSPCYDQSPVFADLPTSYQLSNSTRSHHFTAYDRDHDSLFYRLESPLLSEFTPVSWNPGYSASQPFPNSATDPGNQDVVLDSVRGKFTVALGPDATAGYFYSSMVVESWRYGDSTLGPQLIAEVKREIPLTIFKSDSSLYCNSGNQINSAPVAMIDTTQFPQVRRNDGAYMLDVYAGDTAAFTLVASDQDLLGDCSFQTVKFSSSGTQANNVVNNSIQPCGGIQPCADFSPGSGQSSFNNQIANQVNFKWATDTQHIYNRYGRSSYLFLARFEDNFCPSSAGTTIPIIVNVIDSSSVPSGVGLAEHPWSMDLKIYPNPVSDKFTIDLNQNQRGGEAQVEILDAAGRMVSQYEVPANVKKVTLDAPASSGVYMVILKREGEHFFSQIIR